MARKSLQKLHADFRQGWVDISNPIQQPEGTVKDIENFDINIDGTLSKRPGLERTGDPFYKNITGSPEDNFDLMLWTNVGGDVNRKFAVIQKDSLFEIFDVSHGNLDLGVTYLVDSLGIGLPKFPSAPERAMSGVSVLGKFFYALNTHGAGYLEYDEDSGSVTNTKIDLKVRDLSLWYGPTDEDTGMVWDWSGKSSPWRYYNLKNAGWPDKVTDVTKSRTTFKTVLNAHADPIKEYKNRIGRWPKLSENFYISRSGGGTVPDQLLAFNAYNFLIDSGGTGKPPVGRYIVDVDEFVRSTTSSFADKHSETYTLDEGMSKIAFYAGRVWYYSNGEYSSTTSTSRPKSPLSNKGTVYFSQTLERGLGNSGKCYQDNDPTAEDINQLLATDGGSITIKEIGSVKAMKSLGTSLFILSDQGVWRIAGKDLNTFAADSLTVDKITDKGVLSERCVAVSKDSIFFLNSDGLYAISASGQMGEVSYVDISSEKIKNFFYDISDKIAEGAILKYDESRNLLVAFLAVPKEGATSDEEFFRYRPNTVLIFNLDIGAFYKYGLTVPEDLLLLDVLYGLDSEVLSTNETVVNAFNEPYTDSFGEEYTLPGEAQFKQASSSGHLLFADKVVSAPPPVVP